MPKQVKRTPNQAEFDKQISRLKRAIKKIEREEGITFDALPEFERPKRVTKQKIEELKAITPKLIRTALREATKRQPTQEIKANARKGVKQYKPTHPRNRSLDAMLRAARRAKKPKTEKQKKPRAPKADKQSTASATKQPKKKLPKDITIQKENGGEGVAKGYKGEEAQPENLPSEKETTIETVYSLLNDWVFNIADAHEGYEDVKRADRDLVWAIIGRARAELGDEQVALNIRNSGSDIEALINRIIYGSDETTVRFDVAELARTVNGRSLTIDESMYLTELYDNRTEIEFDEEDFESDSPYFATLKNYDGD